MIDPVSVAASCEHVGQGACAVCLHDALMRANSQTRAALARESALRDVLREVEWEGEVMGRSCCPMCGGLAPLPPGVTHSFTLKDDVIGHREDCRLAAALLAGAAPREGSEQRSEHSAPREGG